MLEDKGYGFSGLEELLLEDKGLGFSRLDELLLEDIGLGFLASCLATLCSCLCKILILENKTSIGKRLTILFEKKDPSRAGFVKHLYI